MRYLEKTLWRYRNSISDSNLSGKSALTLLLVAGYQPTAPQNVRNIFAHRMVVLRSPGDFWISRYLWDCMRLSWSSRSDNLDHQSLNFFAAKILFFRPRNELSIASKSFSTFSFCLRKKGDNLTSLLLPKFLGSRGKAPLAATGFARRS